MCKRVIALMMATVLMMATAGCKPKNDTVSVSAPKSGNTSFKLNISKSAEAKQYVENLQAAVNKASSKSLETFISVKDEQQKSMLGYINSKELKDMFKFYMSNVKLSYVTMYEYNDAAYLVINAEFYDNFYNDFMTPVLMGGKDVRTEFYAAVDAKLAEYASGATAEEDPELFLQPEETGVPKGVTHKGQDYTSAPAINDWVEALTKLHENKTLPSFNDTMILKIKQSTETSKVEIESSDLVKLLGSLPVFYALDYNYNIEDYDIFRNYLAFNEILDDIELQVFSEWRELDALSDREIQEQASEYLSNGLVFGTLDINKDLPEIRRSIQPATLEAINNMYYNDVVVNRYTMLYEFPEVYNLIETFRDNTELELIKQVGKTYHIRMTAPDINTLYATGECWKMTRQEVYGYLTKKIMDKDWTTQTLYTEIVLQKDSANKYGFAVITDYLDKLLTDGIHPQVQDHLGIKYLLSGSVKDGKLLVEGKPVVSARFGEESDLFKEKANTQTKTETTKPQAVTDEPSSESATTGSGLQGD